MSHDPVLNFSGPRNAKGLKHLDTKNKMKTSPDFTKVTCSGNISGQLLDIYQFLPLCRWISKAHSHLLTGYTTPPMVL